MTTERIAEKLGFEYNPIENFPMAWYETWGYHTKDNIFDRFEPQTTFAQVLKMFVQTAWFLTYILFFGLWITALGQICRAWYTWIKKLLGLETPKIEKQQIA